jgi:hypothetical protein
MEEKDFQRIEQVIGKAVKAEVGKAVKAEVGKAVKAEVGKAVKAEVGKAVKAEVGKAIKTELGSFKEEIKEDFRLQVGILSEDFQHKLQTVAEGHQMLAEKMDRMRDEINNKIDTVASDLTAHRADTEGHKRGYMVSEP